MEKISLKEKISYGIGDFANNLIIVTFPSVIATAGSLEPLFIRRKNVK